MRNRIKIEANYSEEDSISLKQAIINNFASNCKVTTRTIENLINKGEKEYEERT